MMPLNRMPVVAALAVIVSSLLLFGCSGAKETATADRRTSEDQINRQSIQEQPAVQSQDELTTESQQEPNLSTDAGANTPSIAKEVTPTPGDRIKSPNIRTFKRPRNNEPKANAPSKSLRPYEVPRQHEFAMESPPFDEPASDDSGQSSNDTQSSLDDDVVESGNTMVDVFYATDRQSKFIVNVNDWIRIHGLAVVIGVLYLVSFGCVFLTRFKIFSAIVAVVTLVLFLVIGQSATLTWQTATRLAENGDVIYLSEIKNSSQEPLDYGKCTVSIPASHVKGQIDKPSILRLEFSENPERHMVLNRVVKSSKEAFFGDINQQLVDQGANEALVFVHGYNVSFEAAIKRTAQISHDLEFEGTPICYSWASHGSLADYTRDMANADATVVTLHNFLVELVEKTGNTTIHLVAHSMGNRALLQALDRIAVSRRSTEPVFGQLVLAAPDVSQRDFRDRFAPAAMKLSNIVTLYASSNDRALLASTEIHGHDRAGLAGDHLVVIRGVDTVDVSEIDTSFLGHSYYGSRPELLKDLRAVVELSRPASKRKWLTQIVKPGGFRFFRFSKATNPSDSNLIR